MLSFYGCTDQCDDSDHYQKWQSNRDQSRDDQSDQDHRQKYQGQQYLCNTPSHLKRKPDHFSKDPSHQNHKYPCYHFTHSLSLYVYHIDIFHR